MSNNAGVLTMPVVNLVAVPGGLLPEAKIEKSNSIEAISML